MDYGALVGGWEGIREVVIALRKTNSVKGGPATALGVERDAKLQLRNGLEQGIAQTGGEKFP